MARIRIDFPGEPLFAHELPVRISDLNYGNHLGHDSLVSLLHEARARFLRSRDMAENDIDGAGILLVDLAVSYRAEVFYGQTLRVEVGAGEMSSRGCELVYRVTDRESGALVAMAKTGIVFYDYHAKRVAGMPPRFRRMLTGG